MKNLFTILICSSLIACSGGSNSSDINLISSSALSLSDVAGVWDWTFTDSETQLVDEGYYVIKVDGSWTDYDYIGDAADNRSNCYIEYNSTLTEIEAGKFGFERGGRVDGINSRFQLHMSLVDGKLHLTEYEKTLTGSLVEVAVETVVRSNRLESDFSPICDIETLM